MVYPCLLNECQIPTRRISSVEDLSDFNAVDLHEDWDEGIKRIIQLLDHDDPARSRMWYFLNILNGPFNTARVDAIRHLGALGIAERAIITALINAARDNKSEVRLA